MKRMIKVLGKYSLTVVWILFTACSDDPPEPPQITDCSHFKYDGRTYYATCYAPGGGCYESWDQSEDEKLWFHIECETCCLKSVVVIKKDVKSEGLRSPIADNTTGTGMAKKRVDFILLKK